MLENENAGRYPRDRLPLHFEDVVHDHQIPILDYSQGLFHEPVPREISQALPVSLKCAAML